MKILLPAFTLALAASPIYALSNDSVITPEPGTVGLLLLGLTGMGIASWRRNRHK